MRLFLTFLFACLTSLFSHSQSNSDQATLYNNEIRNVFLSIEKKTNWFVIVLGTLFSVALFVNATRWVESPTHSQPVCPRNQIIACAQLRTS